MPPARLPLSAPSPGNRIRRVAGLAAKAGHACLHSSFALLAWAISEFLDGFAIYAMAMYGIPRIPDHLGGDDEEDRSLAESRRDAASSPPQPASRLRLVIAPDSRRT